MTDATRPASLPLAVLLGHTADAISAVRGGTSLNDVLARCPAEARPGTQALAFHAMRWLGAAEVVRRRLVRERESVVAAALNDPLGRWNHPAWWLERLRRDWPGEWEAIADADNAHPPMTLRVNARRSTAAAYVARLAAAGIEAEAGPGHAVRLSRPVAVARLPGFAEGEVSVQDAAAQRAAELLAAAPLAPGARVLDACAAPGGKAAQAS